MLSQMEYSKLRSLHHDFTMGIVNDVSCLMALRRGALDCLVFDFSVGQRALHDLLNLSLPSCTPLVPASI